VRDLGCDDTRIEVPCAPETTPTWVDVVAPATISYVNVYDGSYVRMTGGQVRRNVIVRAAAEFALEEGIVGSYPVYGDDRVQAFDTAVVRQRGGSIANGIRLEGASSFIMSGGTMHGFDDEVRTLDDASATFFGGDGSINVLAEDRSTIALEGPALLWDIHIRDDATLSTQDGEMWSLWMTGASALEFGHNAYANLDVHLLDDVTAVFDGGFLRGDLHLRGSAHAEIHGAIAGILSKIRAWDSTQIVVTGGSFLIDPQGVRWPWELHDDAFVEFVGTGFQVDGADVGFGYVDAARGHITGTLRSGEPLDIHFEKRGSGGAAIRLTRGEPHRLDLTGGETGRAPPATPWQILATLSDAARLEIEDGHRIHMLVARNESTTQVGAGGQVGGPASLADSAGLECEGGSLMGRVSVSEEATLTADHCVFVGGVEADGASRISLDDVELMYGLVLDADSRLEMSGGSINSRYLRGPIKTVYGDVEFFGHSSAVLRGVAADVNLTVMDDAHVLLEEFDDQNYRGRAVEVGQRGTLDVRGGAIRRGITLTGDATLFVHDAPIWGRVRIVDSARADLQPTEVRDEIIVWDGGRLTLRAHRFSSGFRVIRGGSGIITAYDELGQPMQIDYRVDDSSTDSLIDLAPALPVPEPSAVLAQAAALICVALLRRRAQPFS